MSAEVENSKEEDVKEQNEKKPLRKKIKQHWPVGIKIFELVVCAICMGFIYDPAYTVGLGKSHMHHVGIMYTAYTGYMVINCVLLISRAIGDKIPYRTISLFAIIGSALFLITGILLIVDTAYLRRHYSYNSEMLVIALLKTSIGFAFVNVLLFAADAILTFKSQDDF